MKLWHVFFVLVIVFIVGCGSGGGGDHVITTNFKQGTADVSMTLVENAPPKEVYKGSQITMIVDVQNELAYDIDNAEIKLLGFDDTYFDFVSTEKRLAKLTGKSYTNPSGDREFVQFDGISGELLEGAREYLANYFIVFNYDSTLEFADTVCVSTNLYEIYDAGCKVEEKKTYSGQGAPLAITEVEEIVSSLGFEFRLHLKKRGKGEIEHVTLGSTMLGADVLSCSFQEENSNRIEWDSSTQEVIVICRADAISSDSYTTTLTADFSYGYELTEQKQLRLVK
ncbi:hypothetical protein HOI26_05385 [Candidatus Woesearchaeota archaeon]|jgi:hypothetical protein|nr:hypothetical protein [Candidatus Woesearchaeota archaeon]